MSEAAAAAPRRVAPRRVMRDVVRIYRRHWPRLALSAVIVFLPVAILDAVLDNVHTETHVAEVALHLGSQLLELLGAIFYAGLVAAAVVAWRSGERHKGPIRVARHLPWKTVGVLDLLIPVLILIGLILLIVPGLLVAVFLSLAPAFAEVDRTGVKESIRRSIRGVRGNFWRVTLVYLVFVVLASAIQNVLQEVVDHYLSGILILVAIQALFAPFYGLATVTICFDRRDADPTLAG